MSYPKIDKMCKDCKYWKEYPDWMEAPGEGYCNNWENSNKNKTYWDEGGECEGYEENTKT